MRVLVWHVHGAWTTAFVHGRHRYLIPTLPDRGPDGRGRAATYAWPDGAVEVTPEALAGADVDVVVLQRPQELHGLAERWLGGRRPGRDLPAVYVEHNAPQGRVAELRHPAADRRDLTLVHVTHFNDLFWDAGSTPTRVIEHGIVDPGARYCGELRRSAVVINEAGRRGRVTGSDLLPRLAADLPIDLFGIGAERFAAGSARQTALLRAGCARRTAPLRDPAAPGSRPPVVRGSRPPAIRGVEDLPQARLHDEMARRRVYLHPVRWTSLGLSLLEAMHLGMPVVALATTEVVEAVPPEAGVVSTRVDTLAAALRRLAADAELARAMGKAARAAALARYGLARFLADWDRLLDEVRQR